MIKISFGFNKASMFQVPYFLCAIPSIDNNETFLG